MRFEFCYLCDAKTGRAGRGEDSIYRELLIDYRFDNANCDVLHAENEIGPLCEECRDKLIQSGHIAE